MEKWDLNNWKPQLQSTASPWTVVCLPSSLGPAQPRTWRRAGAWSLLHKPLLYCLIRWAVLGWTLLSPTRVTRTAEPDHWLYPPVQVFCYFNLFHTQKISRLCSHWWSNTLVAAMQETCVWSLGREDPLEKRMAIHSSILARRIPWTEEPCGLQSMELQTVRHNWTINTFTSKCITFIVHFIPIIIISASSQTIRH